MVAPETLGLDTRVEVRKTAIRLLEEMPEGVGRLVIDLARTRHVDSAGQVVVLRNASEEIRFLLVLTKLDDLFQLESPIVN
jgi:anti-anti-sigma regulatory factor